jgi:WD40 repeat protein
MVVARNGQTATLLPDGRVLIVGGTKDTSAELYDPAKGMFSLTGSMVESQPGATTTLLQDGRALITGGTDGSLDENPVASAELYDPATGLFSRTGSMTTARSTHTATLLASGLVLIAGGAVGTKPSAELYDPRTGTFRPTGSPVRIRAGSTATLLPDGRVLLAGGTGSGAYNDTTAASAELYNPKTGKFALTGSMTTSRWSGQTATLLSDGRVLIVGGNASSVQEVPLASAELYDPTTGKFSATGPMHAARDTHSDVLLHDGRVLVLEGAPGAAELYDPATGQFTLTGIAMPFLGGQTATSLTDGRVLITGGSDGASISNLSNSAELYQP